MSRRVRTDRCRVCPRFKQHANAVGKALRAGGRVQPTHDEIRRNPQRQRQRRRRALPAARQHGVMPSDVRASTSAPACRCAAASARRGSLQRRRIACGPTRASAPAAAARRSRCARSSRPSAVACSRRPRCARRRRYRVSRPAAPAGRRHHVRASSSTRAQRHTQQVAALRCAGQRRARTHLQALRRAVAGSLRQRRQAHTGFRQLVDAREVQPSVPRRVAVTAARLEGSHAACRATRARRRARRADARELIGDWRQSQSPASPARRPRPPPRWEAKSGLRDCTVRTCPARPLAPRVGCARGRRAPLPPATPLLRVAAKRLDRGMTRAACGRARLRRREPQRGESPRAAAAAAAGSKPSRLELVPPRARAPDTALRVRPARQDSRRHAGALAAENRASRVRSAPPPPPPQPQPHRPARPAAEAFPSPPLVRRRCHAGRIARKPRSKPTPPPLCRGAVLTCLLWHILSLDTLRTSRAPPHPARGVPTVALAGALTPQERRALARPLSGRPLEYSGRPLLHPLARCAPSSAAARPRSLTSRTHPPHAPNPGLRGTLVSRLRGPC